MEGGVVVTDDDELYHILLALRSHGWTRHLPEKNFLCTKSDNDFEEKFRFLIPGYNVRPIEMCGATGINQLDKMPKMIQARRENAKLFQELFLNNNDFIIQKEIGQSSWFGFAITIKEQSKLKRHHVLEILTKANIETRPIVAGNIAKKEMIAKYFDYSIFDEMKNAEIIDRRGFYVGNHSSDIKEQIKYLAQTLNNIND
jgi:CDP-6-deoxy-D-xylo-4-hexulose-3-dehydrase